MFALNRYDKKRSKDTDESRGFLAGFNAIVEAKRRELNAVSEADNLVNSDD